MKKKIFLILLLFVLSSCVTQPEQPRDIPPHAEVATFAGGCFWCMEKAFENYESEGIYAVVSGFSGGNIEQPTYKQVSAGSTGHVEVVQVYFDPETISYHDLLEIYWRQINPTDAGGSFVDRGSQYTSIIFYHNEGQRQLAEISKRTFDNSGKYEKPIVTEIRKFEQFYPAEDYHQDYSKKNPLQHTFYETNSGRQQYRERVWGEDKDYKIKTDYEKPTEEALRMNLTKIQYEVTQEDSTEPAFNNEFFDEKREGIYVDIVSGEPLFSSKDKFDSKTGWPSFTKPIDPSAVVELAEDSLLGTRIEVRSRKANSHLGHVFFDGPDPTGLRYCINSAALRFIPREDLEKEGYGEFVKLFEEN